VIAAEPPDYVLVGHVTKDYLSPADLDARPDGGPVVAGSGRSWRYGGTVVYAGVAAQRLGRRVGIATSFASDDKPPRQLEAIEIARASSAATTTLAFDVGPSGGRSLRLLDRAADLALSDVPEAWRVAAIVHLAPVIGEVDLGLVGNLEPALVGATLQGWLRHCTVGEMVTPLLDSSGWPDFGEVSAAVVSIEDLTDPAEGPRCAEARAEAIAGRVPVLVATDGAKGCTLFHAGRQSHIAACPVDEVDSTGAGDVFAASFFIRLSETSDPLKSARFASCAAALSVEGVGTSRIPSRSEVLRLMSDL